MVNAAKAYTMLGNADLWQIAQNCHTLLTTAGIPHCVVGGVAVCLHGYQRNTRDIGILIRPEDQAALRQHLEASGLSWNVTAREFRSESGIAVQVLLSGERAGRDSTIRLPDPALPDNVCVVDGLPALTLARLIEVKLACGEGNLRRTHRDFADVVELIAIHELDGAFARFLHRSVRKTFRELVRHASASDPD